MNDFIFIQKNSEVIAVGTGVLEKRSQPDARTPSFYINDFFLEIETPWIIPATFQEMSIADFKARFLTNATRSDTITWQPPDDVKFRKFFQKIRSSIEQGLLEKIVPVQFEYGKVPESWLNSSVIETIAARFAAYLSSGLYLFGYQQGPMGFCGLTPELIFEQDEKTVMTAALAGTTASQFGDRSIKNPKDFREHQLVVDDIKQVLSRFGNVMVGDTQPYWNGSLIHLRAKLEVICSNVVPSFSDLVRVIHPTAALGVYPRTANAQAILKSSDAKVRRGYFAAPFGVHYPDRTGLCVAAIRSVFWENDDARIGAGCGVIEESDVELELTELVLKRRAIKEKLITEL